MADTRISNLTLVDEVDGSDLLALVDNPSGSAVSSKATVDQVATLILPDTTDKNNVLRDNGGIHITGTANVLLTSPLDFGLNDFSLQFGVDVEAYRSTAGYLLQTHDTGNYRLLVQTTAAGVIQFVFRDTGNNTVTSGYTLPLTGWVDIIITFDRDGNALIYQDGLLVDTIDISSHSAIDIGNTNTQPANVYEQSADDFTYNANRFRAFNFALTADQVLDVHQHGVPAYMQFGDFTDLIAPGTNNGGFETAGGGGADVFANWVEAVSGTSSINDETVDFVSGAHACRLDMDGSGSNAQLWITGALAANTLHQFSAHVKVDATTGSPSLLVGNTSSVDTHYGLGERAQITPTTSYVRYDILLYSDSAAACSIKRNGAPVNRSFYIDDVYLRKVGCVVDLDLGHGKGLHYPDFTDNENHGTGTGVVNLIDKYTKRVDLAYSASLDVDFDDTPEEVLVAQLTGALTLTGSNYHENGETAWRFTADGTDRVVTPPGNWNDIRNVGVLTVLANKTATIVIISSGTTEAETDFFFIAEP